jgi:N-acetylneuraminic acid mutarotase
MNSSNLRLQMVFLLAAAPALVPGAGAAPRSLDLTERIAAQEAIQRVYYDHQLLTTEPFEEAVAPAVHEAKVRQALLQSAAIERFWGTPVTAQALRRELERIARRTLFPERLREIYRALGDDPVLVQEALARPVLVDRLTRNFYAFDDRFHTDARAEADDVHRWMERGRLPYAAGDPHWTVVDLVRGRPDREPSVPTPGVPERIFLDPDEFARRRQDAPGRPGDVGPVVERRDAFTIEVALEVTRDRLRLGTYTVPKRSWDEWWAEASRQLDETAVPAVASDALPLPLPEGTDAEATTQCPGADRWDNGILDDVPEARYNHTAVWTGAEMIVWGGTGTTPFLNSGGTYDPLVDVWRPITRANAPASRRFQTAIWTGTEMIVWGGIGAAGELDTGGRYNPSTDTWTATQVTGAPFRRSDHTAVWTGTEMIIWGGVSGGLALLTGARYNPATDSWTPTTISGAPQSRNGHSAVWTGTVMVVWGGNHGGGVNNGGRYNPATDTWTPTSLVGAPEARAAHSVVWTGTEMIVWGGVDFLDIFDSGGRYNPVTDIWTAPTRLDAPAPREGHTAVWTGSKMVIWGGAAGNNLASGGEWDLATDTWQATSLASVPSARSLHTAVWTGDLMVVWGGAQENGLNTTGGRYDPDADIWTPTASANGQGGRKDHTAVWTGTEMIVWGGFNSPSPVYLQTGGRYDPLVDDWTATSMTGAPSAREVHLAAWTGTQMLVWGGYDGASFVKTGGRYDALTDSWTVISPTGAPSARLGPTGAWTGSEWVIWGGFLGGTYYNDGARYQPATNTWTPTSGVNAPVKRHSHSAIWTGTEMVVWGGVTSLGATSTGARYNPTSNAWTGATSLVDAPSVRNRHTGLWTGDRMIIWTGYDGVSYLNTGGVYDPGSDLWTTMSTVGAPEGRTDHTAVWNGEEMLVWGGNNGAQYPYLGSGGRYDPVANAWQGMNLEGAPSPRNEHSAVWIGAFMVIWGGSDGSVLNNGGRYAIGDPPPGEATGLALTDVQTLTWTAAAGNGVQHDVLRGQTSELPVGTGISETCLAQGVGTTTTDATSPAVGAGFWYLARGTNACGKGPWGFDSFGTVRDSLACP